MARSIVLATSAFSTARLTEGGPGQVPPRTAMPTIDKADEATATDLQVAPLASTPQNPAAAMRNPVVETSQRTDPATAAYRGARCGTRLARGIPLASLPPASISFTSAKSAMPWATA